MKRCVPGETLEQWFAGVLRPRLVAAVERGVIRDAQVEILERHISDLCRSRPSLAPVPARASHPRR